LPSATHQEKSFRRSRTAPNLPSSYELRRRSCRSRAGEPMETLTFRSKYDYSSSKAGIEIPVSLRTDDGRTLRLLAKVDTGAAFCIFQRGYAEQLGIVVERGVHIVVGTPAGSFDAYGHTVTLSCHASIGSLRPQCISPHQSIIPEMSWAVSGGCSTSGWRWPTMTPSSSSVTMMTETQTRTAE